LGCRLTMTSKQNSEAPNATDLINPQSTRRPTFIFTCFFLGICYHLYNDKWGRLVSTGSGGCRLRAEVAADLVKNAANNKCQQFLRTRCLIEVATLPRSCRGNGRGARYSAAPRALPLSSWERHKGLCFNLSCLWEEVKARTKTKAMLVETCS